MSNHYFFLSFSDSSLVASELQFLHAGSGHCPQLSSAGSSAGSAHMLLVLSSAFRVHFCKCSLGHFTSSCLHCVAMWNVVTVTTLMPLSAGPAVWAV